MSAECREAGDDVITRFHRAHFLADLFHDARGLMAEDGWKRVGVGPLDEVQIGVTDAGGGGAD